MNSKDRKSKTEEYLKSFNIPILESLPQIEEEEEAKLRPPAEIAKRIIILVHLNVVSENPEARHKIIDFLKNENLWDSVSEEEKALFQKEQLSHEEKVDISWRAEGIALLLWALKKIDKLGLPVMPVNIPDILKHLPSFLSSPSKFINSAESRSISEILDMSDLLYRLHWATRNAKLTGTKLNVQLNPSIVYERHYAINWVTYYADNWDDVTTDT